MAVVVADVVVVLVTGCRKNIALSSARRDNSNTVSCASIFSVRRMGERLPSPGHARNSYGYGCLAPYPYIGGEPLVSGWLAFMSLFHR